MSYPRYSEYKDSGVEWLGQVPAHWEVKRLRYLCEIETGNADTEDATDEGRYPFYVRSQTIERLDSFMHDCEGILTAGDGAGVGKVFHHHVSGPFAAHQRVYVLTAFRQASGRFLFHYLRENFYKIALDGGAKSTVDSLRRPMFTGFPVALPPAGEASRIVEFVDRETGKLDTLIADQERLITLIQEKRQATVTHAVTKGLNPNAPMKDSGVEWLGQVPAHWELIPLKHTARLFSGGTPSKERPDYWDGDVPWASAKDLKSENLTDTTDHITELALEDGANQVQSGDLMVVVRGMILAHSFPVTKALVPMAINQDLKGVRPGAGWNVDYFAALLRASKDETLRRLDEAGHGTKALRMDAWVGLPLPKPPEHEQANIASFIGRRAAECDALTADAQRTIALLRERRTALITAAVTGQIDVRGFGEREAA